MGQDVMLSLIMITLFYIAYLVYKIAQMLQEVITNQRGYIINEEWVKNRLPGLVRDVAELIKKK